MDLRTVQLTGKTSHCGVLFTSAEGFVLLLLVYDYDQSD